MHMIECLITDQSNDCFIHGAEEIIFYTHCIDLLYWIQSVIMIG